MEMDEREPRLVDSTQSIPFRECPTEITSVQGLMYVGVVGGETLVGRLYGRDFIKTQRCILSFSDYQPWRICREPIAIEILWDVRSTTYPRIALRGANQIMVESR